MTEAMSKTKKTKVKALPIGGTKDQLHESSDIAGLPIAVFPRGCSKWSLIEYRLFS